MALMIAYGVTKAGAREILAVEPMFDESEDSWRAFFRKLKARGIKRTALCISDAHAGIQAAVRKEWLGSSWQRCKVHCVPRRAQTRRVKCPSPDKTSASGSLGQMAAA